MPEPAPLPYDQDPDIVLTIDPRLACACGTALQLFSLYYGKHSIYVLPPNSGGASMAIRSAWTPMILAST